MNAIKKSVTVLIFAALLSGCGFFDSSKELVKQLEYYKNYAKTLEEKVKSLTEIINTLKGENTMLKSELEKYREAHDKMLR